MCAALALSRNNMQVTVLERDGPPPEGDADAAFFDWNRRGAAQFRHPHAFLGLMCNILQDNYPDLVEAFWSAGARKVTFDQMLPPALKEQYIPVEEDKKLWLLMCRRATIETVLRRYVGAQKNIEIRNEVIVNGVILDSAEQESACPTVKGISIRLSKGESDVSIIEADIVIDASGRTSQFQAWLAKEGVEIKEEKEAAEIVYYTRHYQLLPGVEEPSRHREERSAGDLGYLKFGVFPGEGGNFAVIICLPDGESKLRQAVKNAEQFDEIVSLIPGVLPWVSKDKSRATTPPFGFSDIHAVWKHFVSNGKPQVLNFFAVGDAAVRTNPLYGRGCSISALHAHILADVLAEIEDPIERALIYEVRTEEKIRPIYKASLNEDRQGIQRAKAIVEGRIFNKATTFKKWLRLAIGDAVGAAAREQIHVLRGAMRTFNLLEKPGDFLSEWPIRLTLMRYMLKGREQNAKARYQPGPSRNEMIELVDKNRNK